MSGGSGKTNWARNATPPSWRGLAALLSFSIVVGCSDDPTSPPVGDDPPNGSPHAYDHEQAPGASAQDFLADEAFDRLIVEVQYVEGFAPTPQALEDLEGFLTDRLHKVSIEVRAGQPIPIEPQDAYSAADMRAIEAEHRTTYTEGTTLAAYFLFLDGEYEQPNVLGIAYYNTSMAIFSEVIADNTGGAVEPSREKVEAIVAKHEFGHILGLVDNGTEMQIDHRHEDHGPHCQNENCLMYYAVRLSDFIANLLGEMPELDDDCLEDLRANGGR